MIDHLLGRPSTKLKRLQVFSVILFWLWFLGTAKKDGPSPLIRRFNRRMKRFSPWQMVVFSSLGVYTIRHLDSLLGFGAPEPLARMYSRNFYRTTWIVTALDAGFATAMNVKPKWLRDLMSMIFSVYYVIYANEADEKLRKYRAFCTVQMMRTTWEKTTNPYIRAFTWFHRPSLPIARPLLIPRPSVGAHHTRPTKAWLFYPKTERQLRMEEELVLDFCGGGYICMNPQHHEERLRQLAKQMQKPVLAVDYCKAPEYPYPFALEECFDLYRTLHETAGKVIGMSGSPNFRVILTGDSAGGNLASGVVLKTIEYPQTRIQVAYAALATIPGKDVRTPPVLPKPIGVLLSYPSLNFGFSSWMKPEHLRLLRQQSEVNLDNLAQQGSLTTASSSSSIRSTRRRSAVNLAASRGQDRKKADSKRARSKDKHKDPRSYHSLTETAELHLDERARYAEVEPTSDENGSASSTEATYDRIWAESTLTPTWERSSLPWGQVDRQAKLDEIADREELRAQVKFEKEQKVLQEAAEAADNRNKVQKHAPFNTRLTVTSMAGYFQDRIITQGMLRAMAILYIGPKRQPDLDHDYFLSPVVAPAHLLAEFPPVLFICGEKDPLCDDTVVMAGRIREAKLAKKADMERRRAMASARFGEGLRTTPIASANNNIPVDPIENESPEDWVQMRIIEGWSHGFLQMSSLMPEAKQVIAFLGTWMSLVFEEHTDKLDEERHASEHVQSRITNESQAPLRTANKGAAASPGAGTRAAAAAATLAGRNAVVSPTPPSAAGAGSSSLAKEKQPSINVATTDAVKAASPLIQGNEADDEDDDEDDGPIMVIPKGGRRLSNRQFSPAPGSPRATQTASGNVASPSRKLRELTGSPVPPQIEALRAEQARSGGHQSLSDGEASSPTKSKARTHLSASNAASLSGSGRAESELHLPSTGANGKQHRSASSSSSTPRRLSKNGTTQLDEKYRSMLVEETNLLARRRDDLIFGLEGNSALVGSDDDDDLHHHHHHHHSHDSRQHSSTTDSEASRKSRPHSPKTLTTAKSNNTPGSSAKSVPTATKETKKDQHPRDGSVPKNVKSVA